MEVFHPSPVDVERFRNKTRPVYTKWAEEIGTELARGVETIVNAAKWVHARWSDRVMASALCRPIRADEVTE